MPHTELAGLYQAYLAKLSDQDIDELSQAKRFTELYAGDPAFRQDIYNHLDKLSYVADKYHLTIDIAQIMPWLCQRFAHDQLPAEVLDTYKKAPHNALLRKWIQYRKFLVQLRQSYRVLNDASQHNPSFHAWRLRQINRCDDTLKMSATHITHPSFAFELSDGCSVGCWFCGIAADKFNGYFLYNDTNQKLWRGMLTILRTSFGINPLQSAFCYWATDPTDNPDYLHFIKDFYDIAGIMPQSTLARPVKNVCWTKGLLDFSAKHPSIVNRFSITSLSQLKAVHKTFSAKELFPVELVMQHKQAKLSIMKSNAGRARLTQQALLNRDHNNNKKADIKSQLGLDDQHTTIACVSGFLINLCQKKIQLISPRVAGHKFPLGYKVHDECYFDSLQTFTDKINAIVEKHMASAITQDQIIRFREDLHYHENTKGFFLQNANRTYHINLGAHAKTLGKLIHHNQNIPLGTLMKQSAQEGANVLYSIGIINDLYKLGLLSDDVTTSKM